jgi:O-antigen ligase
MISLVLTALVWMICSPVRRTARLWRVLARTIVVVGGAAGLVIVALLAGELLGINPFERFLSILSDASVSYREQAIRGALLQFATSPIFGGRMLEQTTFDYPHNVLVEALMAIGVFGGLALATYMTFAAVSSLRIIRRNVSCQWLGMCCLMQLFAGVTSGSLYLSDSFWALSAAAIAMSSRRLCSLEWKSADESPVMPLSRRLLNSK